jgi:hypothetical protein
LTVDDDDDDDDEDIDDDDDEDDDDDDDDDGDCFSEANIASYAARSDAALAAVWRRCAAAVAASTT